MARAPGSLREMTHDPTVTAAMLGDGDAIRLLWERHRRWVAAVLLSHKPDFEDLEDLLQEVALTFISRISTLRDEANLRPWLHTVAVNTARAAGRNGRHRPRLVATLPETMERRDAADDELSLDEHARRVLRRVQELPEAYRTPLLLRALQGMRSRQIAEILGIEPALVDTRIARARRMLREVEASAVKSPVTEQTPSMAVAGVAGSEMHEDCAARARDRSCETDQ